MQITNARTGLPRHDYQDRTARTGLPGHNCHDMTARTGLSGLLGSDGQDRTITTYMIAI
jgi:hypothetical protein